jgi:hypothetical protein
MTSDQHNRYVAYSFLGYAGFQLFWLLLMIVGFSLFFRDLPPEPDNSGLQQRMMELMIGFMSVFFGILTLPSLIAAWAMLKRKPWARIAGIVGAVFCALSAPVGTAVCVYSIWFWTSDRWKEVYEGAVMRDHSTLGLSGAEEFSSADSFASAKDWSKEPPDWR